MTVRCLNRHVQSLSGARPTAKYSCKRTCGVCSCLDPERGRPVSSPSSKGAAPTACLFCRERADASREEHILPESLGGKQWACLPEGIVCSKCNQYFGSKVEGPALGSFPFLPFRLLLGIPTKKSRAPSYRAMSGTLRSGSSPGTLGLDPESDRIEQLVSEGQITQVRLLAEPAHPVAVCRLLLKMGLEVVARTSLQDALSTRFDAARVFARMPRRSQRWWFLVACDHQRLFKRFQEGVSPSAWASGVSLSTVEEDGAEIFHLRLLELSLMTPLQPVFEPAPELRSKEPEWRLFEVTA